MTMTAADRRNIEREVIAALIDDALAEGYSLSVYDGGAVPLKKSTDKAAILDALFSVDDEYLIVHRGARWVGQIQLVHGNDGYDVIADYTPNLDHIMVGADKISEKYQ